jgi:excisionase family DNA binding protein
MDDSQALVSVGDAARHLKRSTEQVRRYLREGRLDGRRIGGQWFIDRAALDTFASAARQKASFVDGLVPASEIRPLDDVVGIGSGPGSNMADGKLSYRLSGARRRN